MDDREEMPLTGYYLKSSNTFSVFCLPSHGGWVPKKHILEN